MTHDDESAAQTRWWILLGNSATFTQQRTSGPQPPFYETQASTPRDGWKRQKRRIGRTRKGKTGGAKRLPGRTKVMYKLYGLDLMTGRAAINAQLSSEPPSMAFYKEFAEYKSAVEYSGEKGPRWSHSIQADCTGKKLKKWVLQDPNHKALCSAVHVCITSCHRELWTATVTFLNRTVHVRKLF